MSGCIQGVQTLIAKKQSLSVFVHCCNHALDLALQEAARDVKLILDTLQTAQDGANIVHESSKRQALFESLASDIGNEKTGSSTRLQPMCPTRWCVRSTAIYAFLKNYEVTLATFDQLSSDKSVIVKLTVFLHVWRLIWVFLFAHPCLDPVKNWSDYCRVNQ